jgi:hypothetical protein
VTEAPRPTGSPVQSPCVGVCDLDEAGYCRGCRRTIDEVAAWTTYSEAERAAVIGQLDRRWSPGGLVDSGSGQTGA